MLLEIVKQIVAKEGEQILSEPKRVNAFFSDLAKDEPKLQKRVFIECLEHDTVETLKNVTKEERANCKENLAQRLYVEERRYIELYREAIAVLCEVLFGEEFLEPQNKDNDKLKPEDSLESSLNLAKRSDIERETKECPFCGEKILAVAIKCKHCQSTLVTHFTDPRDGKVYRTVMIGNQVWIAKNLNFDCPNSKCYSNDPKNAEIYGRLYDWETAKKACPPGWHLPSNEEWQTLVDFAGGEEIAGKRLKAKNGWNENGNGTDEFGFSALPGGHDSSYGGFDLVGNSGYWWSSNEHSSNGAYARSMFYFSEYTYWYYGGKSYLFSIRCIQDKS